MTTKKSTQVYNHWNKNHLSTKILVKKLAYVPAATHKINNTCPEKLFQQQYTPPLHYFEAMMPEKFVMKFFGKDNYKVQDPIMGRLMYRSCPGVYNFISNLDMNENFGSRCIFLAAEKSKGNPIISLVREGDPRQRVDETVKKYLYYELLCVPISPISMIIILAVTADSAIPKNEFISEKTNYEKTFNTIAPKLFSMLSIWFTDSNIKCDFFFRRGEKKSNDKSLACIEENQFWVPIRSVPCYMQPKPKLHTPCVKRSVHVIPFPLARKQLLEEPPTDKKSNAPKKAKKQ